MFDAHELLERFMGTKNPDGSRKGPSGDLVTGLAAGGLAAVLLGTKPGRKLALIAVKIGGLAAIAGLAYRAWKNWRSAGDETGLESAPPLLGSPRQDASLAILRAMMTAAKADGHIDDAERRQIFIKLDAMNLEDGARTFVMAELEKPLDIDAVAAAATSPAAATEIYMASVLAIAADTPAERAYLEQLAALLKLDPALKASIETEAASAMA